MQSPSPPQESTRDDSASFQRKKYQPPKRLKSLERGELSHKTNTCGPTAPEMEMTHKLDVLIVSYARGGKELSPSGLGPNRENYQIHTAYM